MSAATSSVPLIAGATGSGRASVLWSRLAVGDRQILVRVDRGGIDIGEGELRYQLERKDAHPLAQEDELLDVLAELEARGLLEAELCFRLTAQGRECLNDRGDGERFAVREDGGDHKQRELAEAAPERRITRFEFVGVGHLTTADAYLAAQAAARAREHRQLAREALYDHHNRLSGHRCEPPQDPPIPA
jgi:hypothetical protein